ncbi:hypothetical protein AB6806_10880 [Bosea sp. RCC_152_1]|uniref:hypothetical protein n=1 Tax=Bosea sp. RCC_152_1 TaxID=3239228 RepID=UPI00352437A9
MSEPGVNVAREQKRSFADQVAASRAVAVTASHVDAKPLDELESYTCRQSEKFALRERWSKAVLRGRVRNGTRLVAGDKITAICIAGHLNMKSGRCDPSIPTLEAETDQSNGTVKNAIKNLKQAGALRRGGSDDRSARMFSLVDPVLWACPEQELNRATHCPVERRGKRAVDRPADRLNQAISISEPGNPLPANIGTTGGIALGRSLNNELLNHGTREHAPKVRVPLRPEEQPPAYGPLPTDAEMEATFHYLAEREECFDYVDECGVDEEDGIW